MRSSRLLFLSVALLLGACSDAVTDPRATPSAANLSMSDAVHGLHGNPHFFWLPPMTAQPPSGLLGRFEHLASPRVVVVCQESNQFTVCDGETPIASPLAPSLVAVFERSSGLLVEADHFKVEFETPAFGLRASSADGASYTTYRILVYTDPLDDFGGPFVLGHADFRVAETGRAAASVTSAGVIGIVADRTLPIRFRIDRGAYAHVLGVNRARADGDPQDAELCQEHCSVTLIDPAETTVASLTDGEGQVVTAIQFQPGDLPQTAVLVIDERDDANCAAGVLVDKRYCYRYRIIPDVEFNAPVRFGICPRELPINEDRTWRIHKVDYQDGAPVLTYPEEVDVSDFLPCREPGATAFLHRVLRTASGWLAAPLFAQTTTRPWGGMVRDLSDLFWGRPRKDAPPEGAFVTTWDTRLGEGTTVTLALAGSVDATIDWGNGTTMRVTMPGPHTHDYGTDGIYTVAVTGRVTAYNSSSNGGEESEQHKLVRVDSWGRVGFTSLQTAFYRARNLMSVPNHTEGLESVTNMMGVFLGATNFNHDIGNWNTSNVTTMQGMFSGSAFNQDIGSWDVSSVKDMASMFYYAQSFNQDISGWDISNVAHMGQMFYYASAFNQDIRHWDTSKATTMTRMFQGASSFNQDLSGWCVSLIQTAPENFDEGAASWVLPRPVWGTCPSAEPAPLFTLGSTSDRHACMLTEEGAAYCWGDNMWGQLGNGTTVGSTLPTRVAGGLQFRGISAGSAHTCAWTGAGSGYCWGDGLAGALGNGDTIRSLNPVSVSGDLVFQEIAVGVRYACGLTPGGTAYCWGWNLSGRLGTGDTLTSSLPRRVTGDLAFRTVSVGASHACGLTPDDAAYCWGSGTHGALGTGDRERRFEPTAVEGGIRFASISAGTSTTCGIDHGGTTYCWGSNYFGSLGQGSTTLGFQLVPAPVTGGVTFRAAGPGRSNIVHTPGCGIDMAGHGYCWGANPYGAVGSREPAETCGPIAGSEAFPCTGVPTAIQGMLRFKALYPSGHFTCGITVDDEPYCWGRNTSGELGTGGYAPDVCSLYDREEPCSFVPLRVRGAR
jgi:surface protein